MLRSMSPKSLPGTTTTPLRIFRQISHKVPMSGPDIELGGASLATEEICERVGRQEAATLGESNPFSLDMASAEKQAAALHAGKRITGHSALLADEPLWAYAAVSRSPVRRRIPIVQLKSREASAMTTTPTSRKMS